MATGQIDETLQNLHASSDGVGRTFPSEAPADELRMIDSLFANH